MIPSILKVIYKCNTRILLHIPIYSYFILIKFQLNKKQTNHSLHSHVLDIVDINLCDEISNNCQFYSLGWALIEGGSLF